MKIDRETVVTFLKSQVAAFAATCTEYSTIFIIVQLLKLYYPFGVAIGAAAGATTNFLVNRHWAFNAASSPVGPQVWRYVLVSIGSLLLNTGGVYAMTETLHIHYMFSVMAIGLIVGVVYNYPLQKNYVYRGEAQPAA